jgi:nuclear pore complex protein Nup155
MQPPRPPERPYVMSSIEECAYVDGLTIAAQQGDVEGVDYVLCVSPDLTMVGTLDQIKPASTAPVQSQYSYLPQNDNLGHGQRQTLVENATVLSIPGRTWDMAMLPRDALSTPAGTPAPGVLNELSHQFGEVARQVVILTNSGVTVLVKRRAIDYLRAIIEDLQADGNIQPIVTFRDR